MNGCSGPRDARGLSRCVSAARVNPDVSGHLSFVKCWPGLIQQHIICVGSTWAMFEKKPFHLSLAQSYLVLKHQELLKEARKTNEGGLRKGWWKIEEKYYKTTHKGCGVKHICAKYRISATFSTKLNIEMTLNVLFLFMCNI